MALRELAALGDVLAQKSDIPVRSLCRQHADAHPTPDAVAALPPAGVLDAVRKELRSACATPGGVAALPTRTLRMTPLVLWTGDPQPAGFTGLLEAFLRVAQARPRWLSDLIEAWLRDFGPDRILLREIGLAIARSLTEATHPRLTPWRAAHRLYAMFDVTDGPHRVGQALFEGSSDMSTVVAQIGMHDPLRANGGFFRAAFSDAVRALPRALQTPSSRQIWARAVGLLEVSQVRRDRRGNDIIQGALRFPELSGETARACLDPWLRGSTGTLVPQEEVKAFLLRVLGDPRVEPQRWAAVGEEATGLIRVWLAQASLEAFLSLISQTNDASQWRDRQKFWRACLAKLPSAEVWVVLGPGLANRARALRDLAGGFGEMDGAGANGQAVLLMRMGDLILSEWSNVGPVRAWLRGSAQCPDLYRRRYDSRELKERSLVFPHQPGRQGQGLWHQGQWRERAAALLLERLQLHLTPGDYR